MAARLRVPSVPPIDEHMGEDMHRWVPYVTVAAGAAYVLKVALIWGSDDTASDAVVGALYLGGLVLGIAAGIGTGLRQRRGRRAVVAVALPVLLVVWVMGLGDVLKPVFGAFSDAGHVAVEGPLLLLGLVLLALGAWAGTSDRAERDRADRVPAPA